MKDGKMEDIYICYCGKNIKVEREYDGEGYEIITSLENHICDEISFPIEVGDAIYYGY